MQNSLAEIRKRCLFRLKEKNNDRLETELDWFAENGGAEALLLMSDFARHLKSKNIHIGLGTQMECSSVVCYGLGISNLNPIEWDFPFDTFVSDFTSFFRNLSIDTSLGGNAELSSFIQKTEFSDGGTTESGEHLVMFPDDDKCPTCLLSVCEMKDLEMLKVFQDSMEGNIYDVGLDESILKEIIEKGAGGHSIFSRLSGSSLMLDLNPRNFSDLCLLYPLCSVGMDDERRDILEIRHSGHIPSTGNSDADRILAESFGVPVYQEQIEMMKKLGVDIKPEQENKYYHCKATVVPIAIQAVVLTAFKIRKPDLYKRSFNAVKKMHLILP